MFFLLDLSVLLIILGLGVVVGGLIGYWLRASSFHSPEYNDLKNLLDSISASSDCSRLYTAEALGSLRTLQEVNRKVSDLLVAQNKRFGIFEKLAFSFIPKMIGGHYGAIQKQLTDLKIMVAKALKVQQENSKKGKN